MQRLNFIFFFPIDANIFNVGETLHPLSKCSTAEIGPTCGAITCHMYN